MASKFDVSVIVRLVDQLSAPMRALAQEMRAFQASLRQVQVAAGAFKAISTNVSGLQRSFATVNRDMHAMTREARNAANAMGSLGKGNWAAQIKAGWGSAQREAQQYLAALRQIANASARMKAPQVTFPKPGSFSPGAAPGGAPGPAAIGLGGRSGFSPNASLVDRAQYRAVNWGENAVVSGAMGLDRANTRLSLLNLEPEILARVKSFAAEQAATYKELTKADIMDVMAEITPQFKNPADAFQLAPELLEIIRVQRLSGDSYQQAKSGMLGLVRAVGLSGRLTGSDGEFTADETTAFFDAYKRAKIIGGSDVTPDQAFQAMKYLKGTGQTLNSDALLQTFIAMPDLRASTYGNQLNMMVRQLTGGATKEAQAAQADAGLITGAHRAKTASGPGKFVYESTADAELLMENPTAWVQKNIMGPGGYLQKQGLDAMTASPAQMRVALKSLFSNQGGENIVNMIVNQAQEWKNQIANAKRLNISSERLAEISGGSLDMQLQSVGQKLVDALAEIADKLKAIILPTASTASGGMAWFNSKLGSDSYVDKGMGLGAIGLGAGLALWARNAIRTTLGRAIAGPVGGAILGGLLSGGNPFGIIAGAAWGARRAAISGAGAAAAGTAATGGATGLAARLGSWFASARAAFSGGVSGMLTALRGSLSGGVRGVFTSLGAALSGGLAGLGARVLGGLKAGLGGLGALAVATVGDYFGGAAGSLVASLGLALVTALASPIAGVGSAIFALGMDALSGFEGTKTLLSGLSNLFVSIPEMMPTWLGGSGLSWAETTAGKAFAEWRAQLSRDAADLAGAVPSTANMLPFDRDVTRGVDILGAIKPSMGDETRGPKNGHTSGADLPSHLAPRASAAGPPVTNVTNNVSVSAPVTVNVTQAAQAQDAVVRAISSTVDKVLLNSLNDGGVMAP